MKFYVKEAPSRVTLAICALLFSACAADIESSNASGEMFDYDPMAELAEDTDDPPPMTYRWYCTGWDNATSIALAWPVGGPYPKIQVYAYSDEQAKDVAYHTWYVQAFRRSVYTVCLPEYDPLSSILDRYQCWERIYGYKAYFRDDVFSRSHSEAIKVYIMLRLNGTWPGGIPTFTVECEPFEQPNGGPIECDPDNPSTCHSGPAPGCDPEYPQTCDVPE